MKLSRFLSFVLMGVSIGFTFEGKSQCLHTPTISPTNLILCPNSTDTLYTQAGDAHQWYSSFSNGVMGSPIAGATDSFLVVTGFGYYTVETTLAGCTEASAQVLVDEWAFLSPVIQSSGQNNYCIGDSTEILMPGGNWVNIQWYLNGSPIPGANNNNYWVTGSGTYVVVASPSICPNTSLTSGVGPTFTFSATPTPTINEGDTTICPGESVLLTTQSFSQQNWYRSATSGNLGLPLSGGTGTSYQVTTTGYYTVVATNGGCQGTSNQVYVEVISLPAPVITSNDPLSFCPGDSAELTLSGNWNSTQWQLNSQDINGANGITITVQQAGSYTVETTDAICPQSPLSSNTITITVFNPIVPVISYTGMGNEITSTIANTYQWWESGSPISGANNQTFTPLNSGYYTVSVTDTNGCEAVSDSFLVTLTSVPEVANADGKLMIWPNPTHDFFQMQRLELHQQVRLISITGKVIRTYPTDANRFSLNGVAAGIYVVEVLVVDGVVTGRLVVE